MRSLIIEGCDASGKTTLIESLLKTYPSHQLHSRASTSRGGPVPNLAEWVAIDAPRMSETGPWIYDRHPLISELIYAKFRPSNRPLAPGFDNPAWVDAYRRIVARESILVICQPTIRIVLKKMREQGPDAHMPGVAENASAIYKAYEKFVWPGRSIRYDYRSNSTADLVTALTYQMES